MSMGIKPGLDGCVTEALLDDLGVFALSDEIARR